MFQQCLIVGNLGRDPEMSYTESGKAVTYFTVAVNERWTGGEKTYWFRVSCWGKLAEITNEYLSKGSPVLVIGSVNASAWTDKAGQVQAGLDLTAQTVKFLGYGGEQGSTGRGTASHQDAGSTPDTSTLFPDEEVPF